MDGVITVSAADRAIAQNSGGEAQREKAHEGYRRSGEPLRCVCGTLCARCRCTYRATSLWPSLTNNLCRKERIVGKLANPHGHTQVSNPLVNTPPSHTKVSAINTLCPPAPYKKKRGGGHRLG